MSFVIGKLLGTQDIEEGLLITTGFLAAGLELLGELEGQAGRQVYLHPGIPKAPLEQKGTPGSLGN